MPELPEVETIRRGLAAHITARTITEVVVLHERPIRRHVGGAEHFAKTLVGRVFGVPARRGKYLWLPFADGDALLAHLGMSGQFRVDDPSAPLLRNTRVIMRLDADQDLRFVDQRMFGGLAVSLGGATLPPEVAHIALDPLDTAFDQAEVVRIISQKRSAIKRILLDQHVISGIGNIYADEALWRAGIRYDTPAHALGTAALEQLLHAVRQVLLAAIAAGGTSFDALYVGVDGSSGYFGRQLRVYGREGEPCDNCGAPIQRHPFAGRSSYFCSTCQPLLVG
ncbi:MAG: bifunctional DNA-formamidopyrimidine glycosylase/DNA-(apurinic or apyrimidinic site) lyase [Propionibacteriaceae bacterium]|jgi:formamidopyrimidine-DNA glycosylase|nr:bifunctional DNA-formamidopyrimidine glycosylase/DNA-(apurinic or apyrimidinic site) lyase [Propionibacteriaceae bacterium]